MRQITTVFGLGHVPWAPGTFGSLAGLALTWALHRIGHAPLVVIATFVVIGVGIWAISRDPDSRTDDPGHIIIDEVAGMMVALWPLSIGLWLMNLPGTVFPWPGWVGAFILFRVFDIWKPWPISRCDRPGAVWIMVDDLAAGAAAALLTFIAAGFSHGYF